MSPLPPGPGNVVLSTLRYLRSPYERMLQMAQRYGDPFTVPSFLGPVVTTGEPATIQTLFGSSPDTFAAFGADLLGPVIGESNLILLSGQRHRSMRKLLTPPFQGARMRLYGELLKTTAEEHAARWPRDIPFEVHRTMQEISLQVILQAVLGFSDTAARAAFRDVILDVIEAIRPTFLFMPFLRREVFGLSAWSRFLNVRMRLAEVFAQELATRRASPSRGQDILSQLLDARDEGGAPLSDADLLIQMVNLLMAGHETTASSLAWALYFVHREPAVRQRLLAEIRTLPQTFDAEAVAALPYLDAVCSETLRINPVAPSIARTLEKPLTLGRYELAAGTHVGVAIIVAHRNEQIYPQADHFLPERFLNRSYSPFEFLPFGGGARRCIGAAFAMYELKIVLYTILRQHSLRLLPDDDGPVSAVMRNTTAGPSRPILMMHEGRA